MKNPMLKELKIDKDILKKTFNENEEIMAGFVKKFLSDDSFDNLEKAVSNNDFEQMFESAHTLKGVSSNLGMKKLSSLTSTMVEELRANKCSKPDKRLENIKKEYLKVIECIKKYE